jgi:hypothetical protein
MFIIHVKRTAKEVKLSLDFKELLFTVVVILCIMKVFGYL